MLLILVYEDTVGLILLFYLYWLARCLLTCEFCDCFLWLSSGFLGLFCGNSLSECFYLLFRVHTILPERLILNHVIHTSCPIGLQRTCAWIINETSLFYYFIFIKCTRVTLLHKANHLMLNCLTFPEISSCFLFDLRRQKTEP